MPKSVPGSDPRAGAASARRPRGFTLLELMIVVAIVAIASGVVALALRDPAATQLEREAQRLALLLEGARSQSRALGVPVAWRPVRPGAAGPNDAAAGDDFQFDGLPPASDMPRRWLSHGQDLAPHVVLAPNQQSVPLGPEPVIGAQRLVLRSGEHQLVLSTDGLGPFEVHEP